MFKKAVRNLTIKYLAIIMVLSLFFSITLYQVASIGIENGLRSQLRHILPPEDQPSGSGEQYRQQLVDASRQDLKNNLILFNLVVLVSGLAASYLLAKQTLEPIELAVDAQNRFTADASHELRTPLTSIRSEIEVALRSKKLTSAESRQLLKSILEEISRLEVLSGGLLTLSRMPEGQTQTKPTIVSIKKVLLAAARQAEPLAKIKDIKIVYPPKTFDANVLGDEQSLVQLLVILLDNAVKYSSPKSTIEVSAEANNKFVSLNVKDNGVGIKPKDIGHIFERFYRSDQSRSRVATNGYGLGLSIAKSIADIHHAKINVTSEPAKGSTFSLRFPIAGKKLLT